MRQTASLAIPMGSLLAADRRIPAFLEGLGLTEIPSDCTADAWLGGLSDTRRWRKPGSIAARSRTICCC